MVRVAFDEQIFALQRYGGISRLFYELIREFHESPLLGVDSLPLSAPVINEYVLSDPSICKSLKVWRATSPYPTLARYLLRAPRTESADIVHNTFYLPRLRMDHRRVPSVVTLYDLIPEILPRTRRRLDFLTRKEQMLRKAKHIICISESTERDLRRVYPHIEAPTTIAYPGVSERFRNAASAPTGAPESFVLHVGNRGSYKDGDLLARAFSAIHEDFPDTQLLFVGGGAFNGWERSLHAELGISRKVHHLALSDTDMPGIYQRALVTVYPSRYEGFGLPVVEAMAAGSPVILSSTSSLPEVGGSAARYFPAGSAESLAQRLIAVLSDEDERRRMSAAGRERSLQFSWKNYATSTSHAYKLAAT